MVDLAGIVQKLEGKNVDLVVLGQGIDTTTMYGRLQLQFNILDAIGEFDRELIKERSMEGRIIGDRSRCKIWRQAEAGQAGNCRSDQGLWIAGMQQNEKLPNIRVSAGRRSIGCIRKTVHKLSEK